MSDSHDPSELLFKGSLDHDDASLLDKVSTMNLERVSGGKVYFISDIHLGDGTHADIFLRKDEHFLAFLDEVEREAQALCIVGDALDFEQAWYFSRILRAHPEVIGRLTRLTDHMRVIYIYGNHDPDIVLFRDILKWQLCDKIIIDGHILAIHGYEFDSYGGQKFEESSFLSRAMMIYERVFRTWIRMPLRDNYTLSNRAIHYGFYWLARWSRLQRWLAPRIGFPDWGRGLADTVDFWTRGVWGDPMGITMPAIDALRSLPRFDTIICGHSHLPGVVPAGESGTYVNLGSWSFGNSQYGIWDGQTFVLKDWISGRRVRDENYRHIFAGQPDRPFEDWFADQYLGYLRFRGGEEGLRQGVRPRPWGLSRARGHAPNRSTARIETVGGDEELILSDEELEIAHRVFSGEEEAPK